MYSAAISDNLRVIIEAVITIYIMITIYIRIIHNCVGDIFLGGRFESRHGKIDYILISVVVASTLSITGSESHLRIS